METATTIFVVLVLLIILVTFVELLGQLRKARERIEYLELPFTEQRKECDCGADMHAMWECDNCGKKERIL